MFQGGIVSKFLFLFSILISSNVWANRCLALPNYILDTDILSCKLITSDEHNQSVVIDVKVIDEIAFSSSRPISWEKLMQEEPLVDRYTLKGKELSIVFKNAEFSCFSAQYYKDNSEWATFYVSRHCCQKGSPWCPDANHQGFVLPDREAILGPESQMSFDPKFDFSPNESSVKNKQKINKTPILNFAL
jgi:hypothetical protein